MNFDDIRKLLVSEAASHPEDAPELRKALEFALQQFAVTYDALAADFPEQRRLGTVATATVENGRRYHIVIRQE